MSQIMNAPAPNGDKKPRKTHKAEQPRLETAVAETPLPQPSSTPESAVPYSYPGNGLSSLELARKEVLDLIGPDGLGLRPDEYERYFSGITGKGDLKNLTIPDLNAVINDAKARLAKRDE